MEMWGTYSVYNVIGLVIVPVVWWLLWRWNDIWHVAPVMARCSKVNYKIPAGKLGFPFFGEVLTFLWYFKILRRPDDFINAKRRKYVSLSISLSIVFVN